MNHFNDICGRGALVLRNAHVIRPRYGLQYILASKGVDGTTKKMKLHSDCLGNGEDPLAKTFQQVGGCYCQRYVLQRYGSL